MRSLLFCLLFIPFLSFAQCDSLDIEKYPDVEARFPGGVTEMRKFIQNNIEYPPIERCSMGQFSSRIYLRFQVCTTGEIQNIKLMRSSNSYYNEQAVELIKKMPDWIPGEVDDLPVSTIVYFPITICLH